MGSGFSKMKKQARQLEEQLSKMQDEMKSKRFSGTSGGGLVTVTLDGEKNLKDIQIKKECVDLDDLDGLQDLVIGAFQDAASKISNEMPALPFGL